MIAYLEQCRSELDAMETADDTLILLNGKLKKAEAVVRAAGAELTQKRKAAAQALEQRIQSELRDLDMNKVRFAIEFTEKEPAADGCDVIRFLMSANAGEDLRPIAKIASGGELARIMLALKNVLAEQESIGTLVFDEVDTGVSGRAAARTSGQQESREDGRCDKSGVFHRGHCRGSSQNFRYLSSFRCICALVRGVLSPCPQRCSTPWTTTLRISCKVVAPYWRALSATVSTSMKMSPETIRASLRSL